jgi:hypothetical protein
VKWELFRCGSGGKVRATSPLVVVSMRGAFSVIMLGAMAWRAGAGGACAIFFAL